MDIPSETVMNCNGPLTLKVLEWFLATLQRTGTAAIIGVKTDHPKTLTEISLMQLKPYMVTVISDKVYDKMMGDNVGVPK